MRRVAFVVFLLILSISLCAQAQTTNDPDTDGVAAFLRSVAATIYKLAWPTATYKDIEFGGFERESNGLAVVIKLSGEGLFEKYLWMKLGIVVNRDGIQDVKVLGHNGMFAAPFETTKAMGNLMLELGRQYSKHQSASVEPAPAQAAMAGAVCIANAAGIKLNFDYRWGTGQWQASQIASGESRWFSWTYDTAEHISPVFEISYDDNLAPGLTEQRYVLDRAAARMPVTCEQAALYRFSLDGQAVLLRAVK
jgi:hypothetical protein